MPRWIHGALGLTLAIAACAPGDVSVPFGLESQAAILVVVSPEAVAAFAVESQAQRHSLPAEGEVEVFVLDYAVPLAALGLEEGPLALADGAEGLPLPPTARVRRRIATDGALGEPSTLEMMPRVLADLRLAETSPATCVDGGGCLGPRPGDAELVCMRPCATPDPPTPPAPPEAARITPCPAGWVEVAPAYEHEVPECNPWARNETCGVDTAQRPGDPTCAPVGPACPAGRFAEPSSSAPAVFYVDAAAAAGGDGSEAAPFTGIAQVPLTSSGTTSVLLAEGTYVVPATLPDPVVLVGACAGRTTLGPLTLERGAITLEGLRARGITVDGASVRLEGVVVDSARSRAISVRSGRLVAHDVLVRGATSDGVFAEAGAYVELAYARIEGGGLRATGGATLRLVDGAVLGATIGARSAGGGVIELERAVVRDSGINCIVADGEGSEVGVREVLCENSPDAGSATVFVQDRAALRGEKLVVRGARGLGLASDGASIGLEDLVVRDTGPNRLERRYGTGLQVRAGGAVTVRRALLLRNQGFGVLGVDALTTVALTDTKVVEVLPWEIDGERGTGIDVQLGAALSLERVYIHRARGMGLIAEDGATVEGSDLFVEEVLPRASNNAYGRGIEVEEGAELTLDRVAVHRAKNIAVHALYPGATAIFTDLEVRDTTRSDCFEFSCNSGIADGVTATLEARIEVTRFLVDGNGQYGTRVINDSRLVLREGRISNNAVGLQVISEDYDLGLVTTGVRYEGNDQNFVFLVEQ